MVSVRSSKKYDEFNPSHKQFSADQQYVSSLKDNLQNYPSEWTTDHGGAPKRNYWFINGFFPALQNLRETLDQCRGIVKTASSLLAGKQIDSFTYPKNLQNIHLHLKKLYLLEQFISVNQIYDFDYLQQNLGKLLNCLNSKNIFDNSVYLEFRMPNETEQYLLYLQKENFFEKVQADPAFSLSFYNGIFAGERQHAANQVFQNLQAVQKAQKKLRVEELKKTNEQLTDSVSQNKRSLVLSEGSKVIHEGQKKSFDFNETCKLISGSEEIVEELQKNFQPLDPKQIKQLVKNAQSSEKNRVSAAAMSRFKADGVLDSNFARVLHKNLHFPIGNRKILGLKKIFNNKSPFFSCVCCGISNSAISGSFLLSALPGGFNQKNSLSQQQVDFWKQQEILLGVGVFGEIDHIFPSLDDKIRSNVPENCRLLCQNCHSLALTSSGNETYFIGNDKLQVRKIKKASNVNWTKVKKQQTHLLPFYPDLLKSLGKSASFQKICSFSNKNYRPKQLIEKEKGKLKNLESLVVRSSLNKYKIFLLEYGLVSKFCNCCGCDSWLGLPFHFISEINHKDGNPGNNLVTNLEALCPNCHAILTIVIQTGYYKDLIFTQNEQMQQLYLNNSNFLFKYSEIKSLSDLSAVSAHLELLKETRRLLNKNKN